MHPKIDSEIKNAQKKKAIDLADKKCSGIIKEMTKNKDMQPILGKFLS